MYVFLRWSYVVDDIWARLGATGTRLSSVFLKCLGDVLQKCIEAVSSEMHEPIGNACTRKTIAMLIIWDDLED